MSALYSPPPTAVIQYVYLRPQCNGRYADYANCHWATSGTGIALWVIIGVTALLLCAC